MAVMRLSERFARLSICYQGRIRLCSLCRKGKCGEQEACERPCEREDNVAKCISLHKYGAQNEAYMSRSAEKWVRGLCFNELGVCD